MLSEHDREIFDLGVIGLGPGGLAACLEAAKAVKTVCAFTDRRTYNRGQSVVLDIDTTEFIEKWLDPSIPDDVKLVRENNVQIKDVERFLARKLEPYIQSGLVKIVHIDRERRDELHLHQDPDKLSISYAGHAYACEHVLAADGVHRSFAKLMNRELASSLEFKAIEQQPKYRYHAAIQLRLKHEPCQKLVSSRDPHLMTQSTLSSLCQHQDTCIRFHDQYFFYQADKHSDVLRRLQPYEASEIRQLLKDLPEDRPILASYKELHKLSQCLPERELPSQEEAPSLLRKIKGFMTPGWNQPFLPFFYYIYNSEISKFFLAGEIPKIIFDEPDPSQQRKMLKAWFYLHLKEIYPIPLERLEYRGDRPLEATVFETVIEASTTPIIDLAHGGVFAQIGDARRSPYYVKGHGLNHAIQGADAFVQGLRGDIFDKQPFIEAIKKFDADLQDPVNSINPETTKLIKSIDRLIKHIEKTPSFPPESLQMLKIAKHKLSLMEMDETEQALKEITPMIEKHARENFRLGYQCWRGIRQLYNTKANTSMMLLEQVQHDFKRAQHPKY